MGMIIPNVEELVSSGQRYRAILKLFDWSELTKPLRSCYSHYGRKGYAVEQGFKCLFLQFLEDKSDREMEEFLSDSLAAKYFCNFGLTEETPDHSYFGSFRERSWKARDKALADIKNQEKDDEGNPTMNNSNIESYSSDPDARYGAKGKNDIWLGFKRHVGVDAAQGLVAKVAVTPANALRGGSFEDVQTGQVSRYC